MPIIPQENVHLRDYLRVLKKRRAVTGIFFLVTFLFVVFFTFTTTPQYKASTKVMLEKDGGAGLTGNYRSSSFDPGFYQTQFQLIKSRPVALRVVNLLSLDENSMEFFGSGSEKSLSSEIKNKVAGFLSGLFSNSSEGDQEGIAEEEKAKTSPEDRMVNAILPNLIVQPIAESRIVVISFTSPHPEFAALIANTTAKAYIEETLNMKMEGTRRTLEWMTKKAEAERLKLEKSEKALHAYMKANDIVTLENRVTGTPEEISEISTQLVRAESERKRLEALYYKVKRVRSPETVSAVASDPSLSALRSQIVTAEKNIMELSGKYGKKHPVMEKALGDLTILKMKKEQEIERIVESIKNEYELAQSTERSLRGQMEQTKGEAHLLNEKFVQYGALKRELDTNRQLYDALMLRIKEQSITEENNPVNVLIVEEAQVPRVPSKPLKALNLSLGMVLGLLGGVAFAFFVEYLDNSVKNPEEAEAVLGAPVLGMVSRCRGKQNVEEIVLKEPLSGTAEGYKALRSTLLLSSADSPPRRILVTSSTVGEGKSTTAVNLATVLAQSENRVVLIDGDLRKPRLHKIFGLNNRQGLSNFLAGASPGNHLLQQGPLPNLMILTSGPIPPNPSELLMSKRMKKLIESLGQEFDMVICDSPPLLSVSDPAILSRIFDGSLLVILAHKTTYELAGRSLKALHDVNARVLGLVLNGVNVRKADYYYSDYYVAHKKEGGFSPGILK